MWSHGVFGLWRATYQRVVRSSFATVPYYRHRWALDGRTDPVLVPGRTGTHGGATRPADAESALVDLIPLAGGRSEVDTSRGLGSVLGLLPRGAEVVVRALDQLDECPSGVIHDRMLGYLGVFGDCARWHLDWHRVYARETDAGLAFTLLRQDSPRFVDVLAGDGVRGRVAPCPRHGTPVVIT
jgi:hypothetical protein